MAGAPGAARATGLSRTGGTVTWNPGGASRWEVRLTGPGPLNGTSRTVTSPRAVFAGLTPGAGYQATVTPLSPTGTPGPPAVVPFRTSAR